jgi:hypothetical protein
VKSSPAAVFMTDGFKTGYQMVNQEDLNAAVSKEKSQQWAKEPGRGAAILVLGIISISMLGPFTGIPAWVMANKDLKKIDFGIIPKSERSITKAGKILGIIGTFLIIVAIIVGILTVVSINLLSQAAGV